MSTKFVAVGDSYTVHNLHPETPYSWVRFLSESKGWDEINLGSPGASNSYILNKAFDSIEEHAPDVMIVMWSDPFRINLFDIAHQILESEKNLMTWLEGAKQQHEDPNLNKYENYIERTSEITRLYTEIMKSRPIRKSSIIDCYVSIVNTSLRKFYILQELCRMAGTQFYHVQSLPTIGGQAGLDILLQDFESTDINTVVQEVKNTRYYKLLSESKEWMGFDFIASNYIKKNNMVISPLNHHPTTEGHKRLANIIGKYIDDEIRITGNGEADRPTYVYD